MDRRDKPNRKPGHVAVIREANPPTTSEPLGCLKVGYDSPGMAKQGAEKSTGPLGKKLYPYRCHCGKWHLTRQKQ